MIVMPALPRLRRRGGLGDPPLGTQPREQLRSKAGVDREPCTVEPGFERIDDTGHEERGPGVEEHDVAPGARFAAQD